MVDGQEVVEGVGLRGIGELSSTITAGSDTSLSIRHKRHKPAKSGCIHDIRTSAAGRLG